MFNETIILQDAFFLAQVEKNYGNIMKYCNQCGDPNRDEARFCTKCGTKFEVLSAPATAIIINPPAMEVPPPAPPAVAPKSAVLAPAPALTPPAQEYYYLDKKNQPMGPYSAGELLEMVRTGRIAKPTWVAAEGDEKWKPWATFDPAEKANWPGGNIGLSNAVPFAEPMPSCDQEQSEAVDLIRWYHVVFAILVPVIAIPWGIINLARRKWRSGVLLIVVPVVWAALAALTIPNFVNARNNKCLENLRMIDAAKLQWALEQKKRTADTPAESDIAPFLRDSRLPSCPAGGVYTIGTVGEPPTCTIKNHILPQP